MSERTRNPWASAAALFREAGLPAAAWSTCPDTAHLPNEYCLIPQVITDVKVFAAVYRNDEGPRRNP